MFQNPDCPETGLVHCQKMGVPWHPRHPQGRQAWKLSIKDSEVSTCNFCDNLRCSLDPKSNFVLQILMYLNLRLSFSETPHYTKCAAVSPVLALPAPSSPNAFLSAPTSPKSSPPAPFQPLATSELANALPPVATTYSTHR